MKTAGRYRPFVVAIPSRGRAGEMITLRLFDGAARPTIFCPANEVQAYRAAHCELEIIGVQADGITATRNAILSAVKRAGVARVVMCDDDLIYAVRFNAGEPRRTELSPAHLVEAIDNAFLMADELRTNVFGFSLHDDPKFYREFCPFSLSSVCVANLMGIILDGQRFDERIRLKEDYDFSLMSLYRKRRILRLNWYSVKAKHHENKGGCVAYRTMALEEATIVALQKKWGRAIVKRNAGGAHSGRRAMNAKPFEIKVYPPIKGV